jgi:hypothetical protein
MNVAIFQDAQYFGRVNGPNPFPHFKLIILDFLIDLNKVADIIDVAAAEPKKRFLRGVGQVLRDFGKRLIEYRTASQSSEFAQTFRNAKECAKYLDGQLMQLLRTLAKAQANKAAEDQRMTTEQAKVLDRQF